MCGWEFSWGWLAVAIAVYVFHLYVDYWMD
jgi:hypothetical protein